MRKPTKLITDATGREKLKVSLSGGRYQLSLNDGAAALYLDALRLDIGDSVPEPSVPLVVATGDAWFPHEKDVDGIIDDLPSQGALTDDEREALVSYVTSTWISAKNEQRVIDAISSSPIADEVDPSQLRVRELPRPPKGIDFGQTDDYQSLQSDRTQTSDDRSATDSPGDDSGSQSLDGPRDARDGDSVADSVDDVADSADDVADSADHGTDTADKFEELPGIGSDRAELIQSAGITTIEQLAATRPSDLAEVPGLSYGIAMVAVEGAREMAGTTQSTADRLHAETGTDVSTFEAALSQLAASGVPPSEAAPVLRTLFGPNVSDIDGVTGQQAYFLWRDGYRTPADVAEASVTELCEVDQLGAKTAPKIKTAAADLLERLEE